MNTKIGKLYIKNMVCERCVMAVAATANKLHIKFNDLQLGEIDLTENISEKKKKEFEIELNKLGFELINSRVNQLIDKIKKLVLNYIKEAESVKRPNLSKYIVSKLSYDYSYLSDLFSSIEGTTIEQYFIWQRIEKVKELLVYDQLSLSEISYKLGYSSVHHLSSQFKKITGLTPTHFKKVGSVKRRSLDSL